jgi:hypothetical protein
MKNKLKTKYLAGGPPQNYYFGQPQNFGMAKYNADAMAQSAGAQVAAINSAERAEQEEGLMNLGKGLMSAMSKKKKGGFVRKFQTGGTCPAGLMWDAAAGKCLPDPNWVGATPGVGVLAEEYLPGVQAAAAGEFIPTDLLNSPINVAGTGVLSPEYLTDPDAVNAATSAAIQPIVGNIGRQARRAGKVTDLVEQGTPMASAAPKNLMSAAPVAGLVTGAVGMMAKGMTSDNNVATVTKGEKFGIGLNSIAQGAAAGSKFGPAGMVLGAIGGVAMMGRAQREAETAARNVRSQEQQLGVANREAWKNVWQGQQTGFGYKSSTNMGMQPTSAYFGAKTGGVRRVPGGKIVPIKGTNAVEYIGNKHGESGQGSDSGIQIDPVTEVEDGETKQPVMMAKSGGKGKMNDYFFSAYLKLGGKSFAQRHKEILKSGGKQAAVQKLAQLQEAVANINGEKDRSPATIAKYGGIHKYQTAGPEKEEELMLGPEVGAEAAPAIAPAIAPSTEEKKFTIGTVTGSAPASTATGEAPKSWSDIETAVGPAPEVITREYLEKINDYCNKFGGNRCTADVYSKLPNQENIGTGERRNYFDSEKFKNLPYENQVMQATESVGFQRGKDNEGIDKFELIGAPFRLKSDYEVSTDGKETYIKSTKDGVQTSPTEFTDIDKEKFYKNEGDYGYSEFEKALANAQANEVANGIKPTTTTNADGSVTVRGAQTADAVKENGEYVVKDADGNIIAKHPSDKSIAERKAQTILMQKQAEEAKAAASPDFNQNFDESKMVELDDNRWISKEDYEKGFVRGSTDMKTKEVTGENVPADQIVYKEGRKYVIPGTLGGVGAMGDNDRRFYTTETKGSMGNPNSPYFSSAFPHNRIAMQTQEGTAAYNDISGTKPNTQNNFDTSKILLEELGYMKGKELDEKMSDGRTKRQYLEEKLNSGDKKKVEEANYEMSLLGANDETFTNSTPEQSAAAQSNADASNVTVRDQNQANAEVPSAQNSVAPGGTTNNAGQAAADAAAAATNNTNGTTATTTSGAGTATTTGTPATTTQPKKDWKSYGFPDDGRPITSDEKGTSLSRPDVPSGQKTGKKFFGDVTDQEYKSMIEANPWFDFTNFDPSKKDYKYTDGRYGSSDVLKFQQEYNKRVASGTTLREDGRLGEQTATSRLYITEAPPAETPKENPKEEPKEQPKKEPCAEGTFRNEAGECVPMVKNINPRSYWNPIPGITQYAAPVWASLNPYQTAEGISGATAKAGPLPRVNLNQERASEREENIAATNLVRSQSGTQAAVSQMFNNKQNANLLKISKQEAEANKGLAAAEQDLSSRVSMFNAGQEMARQEFNKRTEIDEKRYKREERLATLQQFGLVTAGNYTDKKKYEATERLANALDETGSYNRYTLMEALRRDPSFKGMPDSQLKEFATAYYNARERSNEQTNVGGSEKNANTQKTGGARRYTSRLGELTKRKSLNFSK